MQHEQTACEAAQEALDEITVGELTEPSDVTEGP